MKSACSSLKSHSTTIFLWLNPIKPPFCWLNPSQTTILCCSTPDSPTFVRLVPSGKCSAASQRYSTVRLPRDTKRTWRNVGIFRRKSMGLKSLTGWWLSPTPLKNMSSSVGVTIPNTWKTNPNVPNHQPAKSYFSGSYNVVPPSAMMIPKVALELSRMLKFVMECPQSLQFHQG